MEGHIIEFYAILKYTLYKYVTVLIITRFYSVGLARLPPVWPGFEFDAICGLSLLLVLVAAPRLFRRILQFSSLHKNAT